MIDRKKLLDANVNSYVITVNSYFEKLKSDIAAAHINIRNQRSRTPRQSRWKNSWWFRTFHTIFFKRTSFTCLDAFLAITWNGIEKPKSFWQKFQNYLSIVYIMVQKFEQPQIMWWSNISNVRHKKLKTSWIKSPTCIKFSFDRQILHLMKPSVWRGGAAEKPLLDRCTVGSFRAAMKGLSSHKQLVKNN